jgi:hypothetical protein
MAHIAAPAASAAPTAPVNSYDSEAFRQNTDNIMSSKARDKKLAKVAREWIGHLVGMPIQDKYRPSAALKCMEGLRLLKLLEAMLYYRKEDGKEVGGKMTV